MRYHDDDFESRVERIRYQVLRELARHTWQGHDAFTAFNEIANVIVKKGEPPIRCCIYKDRAIIGERIRIGLGNYHGSKDVVQVVTIACEDCPKSGYSVTSLCRGCIAHNCQMACPKDAIVIDEYKHAHIDKRKCIECGRCAKECKYDAIVNMVRPCEKACKVGAITMDENGDAKILHDKCIVCGNCIIECPFGAMNSVSSITAVIKEIMAKKEGEKIFAIIAPSMITQCNESNFGQVVTAIKMLGFDDVFEVADGADLAALADAKELLEKGFVTSSCCPAFVEYVHTYFPELKDKVSDAPSPMILTAELVKKKYPNSKVVFFGPCIAKKWEVAKQTNGLVDYALTFNEFVAMMDSKEIPITELEPTELNTASGFGRGFARVGGLTAAVKQALIELGHEDFEFKPVVCNGLDECKAALTKAKFGKLDANFVEGMICPGGCVGGPGNIGHMANTDKGIDYLIEKAHKKTLK